MTTSALVPNPMAAFQQMPSYGGYQQGGQFSPVTDQSSAMYTPGLQGAPVPGGGFMDSFKSWFSPNVDQQTGVATAAPAATALSTFSGLANTWLGWQQYNLARDSFKESKRQFNLNYDAQRKDYNARIEDRQRARVAANPGAYQSVGSYMAKNGIS